MADKEAFIRALAAYLVSGQARMSIRLEMGDPDARIWASVRNATPLSGYPDIFEATRQLADWLGVPLPEEPVTVEGESNG